MLTAYKKDYKKKCKTNKLFNCITTTLNLDKTNSQPCETDGT